MRSLYGRAWGYEIFVDKYFNNIAYNKIVDLCTSIDSLDTRKDYFVYGLGTIAKFIINSKKLKITGIIDKKKDCSEYSGIPIIGISSIKVNSNVIITPFYDNDKIRNYLHKKDLNLIFF